MLSQGILYVAAGEDHIRAAMRSAETVRKYCPGLAIHLFADWQNHGFQFDKDPAPFTSASKIDSPHRRSKVDYLPVTPFERTLYLDNDSALNADIRDMFRILDRFDMALTHVQPRDGNERTASWRIELPEAFPYYNSGVILYSRTPAAIQLLENWRDAFKEAGLKRDETTLREILWLSDLRVSILPVSYNARYSKYEYLFFKSKSNTKIYHLKQLHGSWLSRTFRYPLKKLSKAK